MSKLLRLAHRSSIQFFSALLIYFLATAAITAPFVERLPATLYNWGDALTQTWTLGWNAQQFQLDPLHLYDAPTFYPYPFSLAIAETMVPQSALALPLILITGNLALAHNLNIVIAFVLNGLTLYLYLRWWKLGYWSALVGGFIYAFGHYHLSHFGHLNLTSSQWIPLVLLAFDLALERKQPRFFFLLGLAFVLSGLSSFYYAFFTAGVVLCYIPVRLIQTRGKWDRRVLIGLAASFAVSALVFLPFGLPYIFLARDFSLTRTFAELKLYSAVPASYLTLTSLREPFARFIALFPPVHPEAVLSPGLVALALGAFGIARRKAWLPATPLVVIGIVGFVLSLGPDVQVGAWILPLPNRLLYEYIPGFAGAMRAISRWGILVLLAVAGLAAFALQDLFRRLPSTSRAWLEPALAIALLVVLFWEYDQSPTRLMTGTLLREEPSRLYAWLAAQPDEAAIELPMNPTGAGAANDFFYQYYTLLHRHRIVNGSSGFAPRTYQEIRRRMESFPSTEGIELLRALNVRYVLLHTAALENRESLTQQLAEFDDALRVAHAAGDDLALEILPAASAGEIAWELVAPRSARPGQTAHAFVVARPAGPSGVFLSERGSVDLEARWYDAKDALIKSESVRVTAPLMLDEHGAVLPFPLHAPMQTGAYRVVIDLHAGESVETLEQAVLVDTVSPQSDPPIQLLNAHVGGRAARAGESLPLILYWAAQGKPERDHQFFIHVDDAAGNRRAQLNGEPFFGALPTSQWLPGEVLVEQYEIPLPGGLEQNAYQLVAGMFDAATGKLIPVRGPDDQVATATALDVSAIIGAGRDQKPPTTAAPLYVEFDNAISFLGYDLDSTRFRAGETIPLVLYWQARMRPADAYTVFLHLLDSQGNLVAQADAPPRSGTYPTTAWNDGEYIRDPHPLQLPADLPPGDYVLRIGLYRPTDGARAKIQTNENVPRDWLDLTTITIPKS